MQIIELNKEPLNLLIREYSNGQELMSLTLYRYTDDVGDGIKATITLADHVYTTIVGEQITKIN